MTQVIQDDYNSNHPSNKYKLEDHLTQLVICSKNCLKSENTVQECITWQSMIENEITKIKELFELEGSRYTTAVRRLQEHKDNNISPDMAYQGALVDALELIKKL